MVRPRNIFRNKQYFETGTKVFKIIWNWHVWK